MSERVDTLYFEVPAFSTGFVTIALPQGITVVEARKAITDVLNAAVFHAAQRLRDMSEEISTVDNTLNIVRDPTYIAALENCIADFRAKKENADAYRRACEQLHVDQFNSDK